MLWIQVADVKDQSSVQDGGYPRLILPESGQRPEYEFRTSGPQECETQTEIAQKKHRGPIFLERRGAAVVIIMSSQS